MNDEELRRAELAALMNARAKVRDVPPAQKGRLACQRADEWLRLREERISRGLEPLPDTD